MRTIRQWKAMLPELRRVLRNTEAREKRARNKRWGWDGCGDTCSECGRIIRKEPSQAVIDKYDLEYSLAYKQRSQIYKIEAWLYTLRDYNKGEPSV